MLRPLVSYGFTLLILFSQVGLPLHFHYCEGILESVSVFTQGGCNDHEEIADLPACCKQENTTGCSKNGGNCCDDKVQLLIQEITSLLPHFDKDFVAGPVVAFISPSPLVGEEETLPAIISSSIVDLGPPIYLLHQSLIFYA